MADSGPMSTEAPAAPPAKRQMSEEHKAKLKAGREAALAKKRAAAVTPDEPGPPSTPTHTPVAPSPSDAALAAEVARLKAELAKFQYSPEVVAALPNWECYIEFVADKRDEQNNFVGEKISSCEDPRWDFIKKYDRPIHGSIVVNTLSRNGVKWDGKSWQPCPLTDSDQKVGAVISRTQIHGQQFRKADIAWEFMRKMKEFNGDVQRTITA